jgi:hypothetical protein
MWLNVAPGAMTPESHVALLDVDVCEMLSLFFQVTVIPDEIAIGFGLYAFVVKVCEPATIDTVDPPPVGEGVVGGVYVEL